MGLDYKLITRTGALQNEQTRNGRASIDNLFLSRGILELVPASVARDNLILPLSLDGETLICAAANPHNLHVQDKLSFILNKKVRLIQADANAISAAIDRNYGRAEVVSIDSMLCESSNAPSDAHKTRSLSRIRSLPALGRSLGRTVTEFKRGVKGSPGEDEELAVAQCMSETAREIGPDPRYPGLDHTTPTRRGDMFHYTVEEGQRRMALPSYPQMRRAFVV